MDLIENKNKFIREFEELQQRDKLWNYCLKKIWKNFPVRLKVDIHLKIVEDSRINGLSTQEKK